MVEWKKCRKKPIVVEFREVQGEKETIKTREGTLTAHRYKDFVIRGLRGEIYPIGKDIFHKSYDVLEEAEPVDLVERIQRIEEKSAQDRIDLATKKRAMT